MRKYIFNNNKIYGGPTDEIFGSDDGFALFLNGMGFMFVHLARISKAQINPRLFQIRIADPWV